MNTQQFSTTLTDVILHAVAGGTDGMRHAAYRVANVHLVEGAPVLTMLESAWDGVGSGADVWWA